MCKENDNQENICLDCLQLSACTVKPYMFEPLPKTDVMMRELFTNTGTRIARKTRTKRRGGLSLPAVPSLVSGHDVDDIEKKNKHLIGNTEWYAFFDRPIIMRSFIEGTVYLLI